MQLLQADNNTLFGIPLSTYRDPSESVQFQYQCWIAAFSIAFMRWTIPSTRTEPFLLRAFFASALGLLAFSEKPYPLICAVELFSYLVHPILIRQLAKGRFQSKTSKVTLFGLISISAACSFAISYLLIGGMSVSDGTKLPWTALARWTPSFLKKALFYFFPIEEMTRAYLLLKQLSMDPKIFQQQVSHLFFVTFHIQAGMGYLGINFLRHEQERRNQLIRMDVDDAPSPAEHNHTNGGGPTPNPEQTTDERRRLKLKQRAEQFNRGAGPFILFVAVPYMIQIIFAGNVNRFSFTCLQHDLHRTIRLYRIFERDDHLVRLNEDSATSPEAYANSMNQVINTNYELINRKLFSLPKILLLPMVISKQPWLVLQVAPFIMLSDWFKGKVMSSLTTKVESFDKEIKGMVAIRSRVESFDLKNAELLQRSGTGATKFTRSQWERLTTQIQQKRVLSDLYSRTKSFFNFVQHHFIFSALVDCALSRMIAIGSITAADIFVFSRAIEDTIDFVLMKSRSEAELARVITEMDRLQGMANVLHPDKTTSRRSRNLLPCHLPTLVSDTSSPAILHHHVHHGIVVRNLHYSRGSAAVRADHVEIPPGIYALTGANGSGKSTLFRILMSCSSNEKAIDLPESILLSTPAEPLVEADDFFRETSCEADEVSVEGTDEGSDRTVTKEGQCNSQGECRSNATEGEKTSNGDGRTLSTSTERKTEGALLPKPKLSITMPSARVVEISQTFYWPLYAKPLDWIFQGEQHNITQVNDDLSRARLVAEKLQALEFVQAIKAENEKGTNANDSSLPTTEKAILKIMEDLQEEKEDWFSELSGGQKSKVEMVRKVFLHDSCPHVLLIDETMAPLDPSSKSLVMSHLKEFCKGSVVIVIYHTDAGQNKEDENGLGLVECVPSNNFFSQNIHLENQMIQLRPIC